MFTLLSKHQVEADERVLFLSLEIEVLRYIHISPWRQAIKVDLLAIFIDINHDSKVFLAVRFVLDQVHCFTNFLNLFVVQIVDRN